MAAIVLVLENKKSDSEIPRMSTDEVLLWANDESDDGISTLSGLPETFHFRLDPDYLIGASRSPCSRYVRNLGHRPVIVLFSSPLSVMPAA